MKDSFDSVNTKGNYSQIENQTSGRVGEQLIPSQLPPLPGQNKYNVEQNYQPTVSETNLNSSTSPAIGNTSTSTKNSGKIEAVDEILSDEELTAQMADKIVRAVFDRAITHIYLVGVQSEQSTVTTAAVLSDIWRDPVQYQDLRAVLSLIWSEEHNQAIISALSGIWHLPAVQAMLSDIWESSPYDMLTDIWRDDISYVEIRSILSQIWSAEHRERFFSVISEIWNTSLVTGLLSSIWHTDKITSILSEIWNERIEAVDVRSVLSQIWSAEGRLKTPLSILSEIWQNPAIESIVESIWNNASLRKLLTQIWAAPVEKIDPRSFLSQIWTDNADRYLISVLSAIWAQPAIRTVLSSIWNNDKVDTKSSHPKKINQKGLALNANGKIIREDDDQYHIQSSVSGSLSSQTSVDTAIEDSLWQLKPREYVRDHRLPEFNCLSIEWMFGRSNCVPVLNLTSSVQQRHCIAYACDHVPVIFDYHSHSQRHLQAHSHTIMLLVSSSDGRWILTADSGANSCVLVHSADCAKLLQFYFIEDQKQRPVAAAFSGDSQYIILIIAQTDAASASTQSSHQQMLVWEWTLENSTPRAVHDLHPSNKLFRQIYVSRADPFLFALSNNESLLFFKLSPCSLDSNDSVLIHRPALKGGYSRDFRCDIGFFTSTSFSPTDPQTAYSATSGGYLILWSSHAELSTESNSDQTVNAPVHLRKTAHKVVRISEDGLIDVSCIDRLVSATSSSGRIMFYNKKLMLISYLQRSYMGRIISISYDLDGVDKRSDKNMHEDISKRKTADSAETHAVSIGCPVEAEFRVPHSRCVVCTEHGDCWYLDAKRQQYTRILEQFPGAITSVTLGAGTGMFLVGTSDGSIRSFDYKNGRRIASVTLPSKSTCLAASACGRYVAAGLSSGHLHVLSARTLQDQQEAQPVSGHSLEHCVFSKDSLLMVTGDSAHVVDVFRHSGDAVGVWCLFTRLRPHYDTICGFLFVPTNCGQHRLISMAKDRRVVEYELDNSTCVEHGQTVKHYYDLNYPSSTPLAIDFYPSKLNPNCIIVADSLYKFRLIDINQCKCVKVVTTPDHGTPPTHLKIITLEGNHHSTNGREELHCYMVHSSAGLLTATILPVDGDVNKSTHTVAHTTEIAHIETTTDGGYVFTSGEQDTFVTMWKFSPDILESQARDRGTGATSFFRQVSSETCQHLRDAFYYTQIAEQGEDWSLERTVSDSVDVTNVIDILRSVGFFPSQQESEDILNELKNRSMCENDDIGRVKFSDLVTIYCNHKPLYDDIDHQLQQCWSDLSANSEHSQHSGVDRQWLLNVLQTQADVIEKEELLEILTELLQSDSENCNNCTSLQIVEKMIPETLDYEHFYQLLVGNGKSSN